MHDVRRLCVAEPPSLTHLELCLSETRGGSPRPGRFVVVPVNGLVAEGAAKTDIVASFPQRTRRRLHCSPRMMPYCFFLTRTRVRSAVNGASVKSGRDRPYLAARGPIAAMRDVSQRAEGCHTLRGTPVQRAGASAKRGRRRFCGAARMAAKSVLVLLDRRES